MYSIRTLLKRTIMMSALLYFTVSSSADSLKGADSSDEIIQIRGEKCFDDEEYTKAYPLLKREANRGSRPAMYRLAFMYENGLGVKLDEKRATYWYKQAAAAYDYVLDRQEGYDEQNITFAMRVANQIDPRTDKEGAAFAMTKIDTDTPETKVLVDSVLDGHFFGLQPYNTNFILPLSYATSKYPRIQAGTHPNNYTPQQQEMSQYDRNVEVEFQLSLKKPVTYDLFGWNEAITVAYTQKVWWQLYESSGPFRETNYLPEIFMGVPTSDHMDETYGLKAGKFGFLHESNGQEGYRSRSWNRFYLTGLWQWDNLFLATRVWVRLSEDEKYEGYYEGEVDAKTGEEDPNTSGDDNPNIEEYLGYGDINIDYLYEKHQFGALLRYNFGTGGTQRGAVELNWSYPFFESKNTFWYMKMFSGYGESLIDYDRSVTKAAFGFSFSRGLF